MRALHRTRLSHIALALVAIAAGLYVHGSTRVLGPIARDVLGDALWAVMMFAGIGALFPRATVAVRGLAALGVCFAVELSQLLHGPMLDSARQTTLGVLVLGSGFDPRDLLAYTLGVGAAASCEWWLTAHRSHTG